MEAELERSFKRLRASFFTAARELCPTCALGAGGRFSERGDCNFLCDKSLDRGSMAVFEGIERERFRRFANQRIRDWFHGRVGAEGGEPPSLVRVEQTMRHQGACGGPDQDEPLAVLEDDAAEGGQAGARQLVRDPDIGRLVFGRRGVHVEAVVVEQRIDIGQADEPYRHVVGVRQERGGAIEVGRSDDDVLAIGVLVAALDFVARHGLIFFGARGGGTVEHLFHAGSAAVELVERGGRFAARSSEHPDTDGTIAVGEHALPDWDRHANWT